MHATSYARGLSSGTAADTLLGTFSAAWMRRNPGPRPLNQQLSVMDLQTELPTTVQSNRHQRPRSGCFNSSEIWTAPLLHLDLPRRDLCHLARQNCIDSEHSPPQVSTPSMLQRAIIIARFELTQYACRSTMLLWLNAESAVLEENGSTTGKWLNEADSCPIRRCCSSFREKGSLFTNSDHKLPLCETFNLCSACKGEAECTGGKYIRRNLQSCT